MLSNHEILSLGHLSYSLLSNLVVIWIAGGETCRGRFVNFYKSIGDRTNRKVFKEHNSVSR